MNAMWIAIPFGMIYAGMICLAWYAGFLDGSPKDFTKTKSKSHFRKI